jgi:hypothetical protein
MPFLVYAMVVPSKETAEDIAKLLTRVREMAKSVGIPILSLGSDSASTEIKAKVISVDSKDIPRYSEDPRHTYWNREYGVKMAVPVFNDGEPLINIPDPSHAAKSLRNQELGGAKTLQTGSGAITFALIDTLLDHPERALYNSDLHNLDRQDDGAAKRMFSSDMLETMIDEKGDVKQNYEGLFLTTFVFGKYRRLMSIGRTELLRPFR